MRIISNLIALIKLLAVKPEKLMRDPRISRRKKIEVLERHDHCGKLSYLYLKTEGLDGLPIFNLKKIFAQRSSKITALIINAAMDGKIALDAPTLDLVLGQLREKQSETGTLSQFSPSGSIEILRSNARITPGALEWYARRGAECAREVMMVRPTTVLNREPLIDAIAKHSGYSKEEVRKQCRLAGGQLMSSKH